MNNPTYKELEKKVKILEKKLQEHELQYVWSIYSQSPIPTFIINKEGKLIEYNEAMLELTGYTHKEVPDITSWMPKLYPDKEYRGKVKEIIRKLLESKIDIKRDVFIISRKNGEKRYVAFSVYNILHGEKQGDLKVVQGEDITERKKAKEALQKSEKRFRSLFESTTEFIHIIDKEGTILQTNPAVTTRSGYTEKEMVGRSLAEFLSPASQGIFACEMQILMEKGSHRAEIEFVCKDGAIIITDCSCNIVHDSNGEFAYIVTLQRDITERKRAEIELQKYKIMFDSAQDAIFFKDLKSRYIIVNDKTAEAFSLSREEIIGKNDYEILPNKAEAKTNIDDDQLVITTGKARDITKHMTAADGKEYWFQAIKVPQIDETGKIIGIVGIARDITDLMKAEEKLKLTQKELEIKAKNLEEINSALKFLLKHQDDEKKKLEKSILKSIGTLVLPYLEKIKFGTSNEKQKTYVNIIETNLSEITKPFISILTEFFTKLTPTEIQIVNLIRENKTTKEIAKTLDISETTGFFHRKNIRTKLGLKNKKTNLRSYLQSVTIE